MYKGELGTANAHKILLKDIGKLFLPEAPVPHCTSIKQWGSYDLKTNINSINIIYNISFKNTYIVLPALVYDNSNWTGGFYIRTFNNTNFTVHKYSSSQSYCNWIAIGI